MEVPAFIEHAVSQGYRFYVYASDQADEDVIIKRVRETVLSATSIDKCQFEVRRSEFIPADTIIFTLYRLHKFLDYN